MTQPQDETCYLESDHLTIPGMRRFSHEAMATTFEVVIVHEDGRYAQQAARAAFDELDRLEAELSRFIENSDISRINNHPANQPLRVGLDAFECLELSSRIYAQTDGAFDVTIGFLFGCWLDKEKNLRRPSEDELDFARQHTGMHLVRLDEEQFTVELLTGPVRIDLGGIGKGYAVNKMAELLREWSIDKALICGGYSSILALDAPDDMRGWPVTLSNPDNRKRILARLYLQGHALGASGLQQGCHIIDPRTAGPVRGKLAAWAYAGDAATADALSTAFMVMSPDEIGQYCERHPEMRALVILQEEKQERILRFGRWENFERL